MSLTREIQRAALKAYGNNDMDGIATLGDHAWNYGDVFAFKMCSALHGRLKLERSITPDGSVSSDNIGTQGPIEMNRSTYVTGRWDGHNWIAGFYKPAHHKHHHQDAERIKQIDKDELYQAQLRYNSAVQELKLATINLVEFEQQLGRNTADNL